MNEIQLASLLKEMKEDFHKSVEDLHRTVNEGLNKVEKRLECMEREIKDEFKERVKLTVKVEELEAWRNKKNDADSKMQDKVQKVIDDKSASNVKWKLTTYLGTTLVAFLMSLLFWAITTLK